MWDTTTEFGQRVERWLAERVVIWLVTTDTHGVPQPSPVWFIREGDTLLFYSKPRAPKVRHIRERPQVALHFDTDDDGEEVVIFHGTARIDEGAPRADQVAEYQAKYGPHIPGIDMTPEQQASEYSLPIRVRLEKVRGF